MGRGVGSILVIDDEPGVSQVLSMILSRVGFRVHTALDGETGCAIAEREQPVLIFCDERMPGLDGYGTLARLKANPATSDIPVVMIGGTHENGLRDWRSEGAASFVLKPFGVSHLLSLVRRLVKDLPTPAR